MNKDNVLRMSREENQNGDEREEKIKLRSDATSAAIGVLLCMIFVFIENIFFDREPTLIWIIYFGMMFSKYIIEAVKLKKKSDIVLSILCGLCFAIYIVIYILDNVG